MQFGSGLANAENVTEKFVDNGQSHCQKTHSPTEWSPASFELNKILKNHPRNYPYP
jgi:hypothetical protein